MPPLEIGIFLKGFKRSAKNVNLYESPPSTKSPFAAQSQCMHDIAKKDFPKSHLSPYFK